MNNLLTDRLIRVSYSDGSSGKLSLPEIFAALDRVDAFPALRPHQRHPWHAFLVQLGALAMHKSGITQLPDNAVSWKKAIRNLTAARFPQDEPWHLVVEDVAKPAFMQPPANSADRYVDYKGKVESPDKLDILLTSKNHDLKSAVATNCGFDDWIFSLISLQTTEGFSGKDNYGISRMNGGLGCRPAFSITPSVHPGAHAQRDIVALLEHRDQLLDDIFAFQDDGIALLWLVAWDGAITELLPLSALDPYYIEICRRVRLRDAGNGLAGVRATSKAPRVAAKALKGRTGDPWTPFNIKEHKSLTLAGGGFTYQRIADYFTSKNWRKPLLCMPTDTEIRSSDDMYLIARSLVRGQGRTEGYHERVIPLSARTVGHAFGHRAGMSKLGEIAKSRIEEIKLIQRILRHAVWTFASGGKSDGVNDEVRALANPWANKLDEIIDSSFFQDLQEEFELDSDDARQSNRNQWRHRTIENARKILRLAQESLPCPTVQRYRAHVRADAVFEGRIRGQHGGFPDLWGSKDANDDQ